MKKNGFTLTEILGVVVILSLLLVVIAPPILNRVKTKEASVTEVQKEMLEQAASLYFSNHQDKNCVSTQTLNNEGYLNDNYDNGQTDAVKNIKSISKSGGKYSFLNYYCSG